MRIAHCVQADTDGEIPELCARALQSKFERLDALHVQECTDPRDPHRFHRFDVAAVRRHMKDTEWGGDAQIRAIDEDYQVSLCVHPNATHSPPASTYPSLAPSTPTLTLTHRCCYPPNATRPSPTHMWP